MMKNISAIIAILTLFAFSAFGQEQTPTPTPTETPAQQTTTPDSTAVPSQTKPEGTIRIGIAAVKVQAGQDGAGQDAGETIRQSWISLLGSPTVEVISIEARLPAQINAEAQQKGCDFVLYSSLSQKHKTSIFGNIIKVAVPLLTTTIAPTATTDNTDPNGTAVNTTQQTVTQAAQNIANNMIAAKTKAKDAIALDYNLTAVGGKAPTLANSLKAKATTDGEDVVTPLIEQAAGAILQAVMKK